MLSGRAREMGLGSFSDVTLAEARDLARDARRLCRQGLDPIEARRAHRAARRAQHAKAMTFQECATAYIAAHRSGWKNKKHAKQWPQTLEDYVYPAFGSLPVQAIEVALVMKAVEPIWTVKPETAGRVRGRIEAVLDWATARGYRQGENPARWKGHLETSCRRNRRSVGSSAMQRCRIPRSAFSWLRCGDKAASTPGRSSSRS